MLAMAIPTLMVYGISENDINEVCEMAANSEYNKNDRAMVVQGTYRKK